MDTTKTSNRSLCEKIENAEVQILNCGNQIMEMEVQKWEENPPISV